MAGDWLPMRKNLLKELEVMRIATLAGYTRREVAMLLFEMWSWFDDTTTDGIAKGVTLDEMSAICPDARRTFFDAVVRVGWLVVREDCIICPNFEYWISASAKKRLLDARRKRNNRQPEQNVPVLSGSEPDKNRTKEQKRIVKKTPKAPKGAALALDGFDEFWIAYPRKTAKKAAIRVWQKLKPDAALLASMLAAIERQKQSPQWTKDNGQYIPHPATWLNGGRWEDQAEAALAHPGETTAGRLERIQREMRERAEKYGGGDPAAVKAKLRKVLPDAANHGETARESSEGEKV